MALIKLLNTKKFARLKGVSRTTVWRRVKNDVLDCYILPGSSKKYFAAKNPNVFKTEEKFLEEILTIESN